MAEEKNSYAKSTTLYDHQNVVSKFQDDMFDLIKDALTKRHLSMNEVMGSTICVLLTTYSVITEKFDSEIKSCDPLLELLKLIYSKD